MTEKDDDRFVTARGGDHLLTSFQCDRCHFINIHGREPEKGRASDRSLLRCIRRANLDSLWSREPKTVEKNRGQVRLLLQKAQNLGLSERHVLAPAGPRPLQDQDLMAAACCLLERSKDRGKYSDHIQFETIRAMRSALHNQWGASIYSSGKSVRVGKNRLKESLSPTDQDWFERFMLGLHKRIGDEYHPDLAISADVMVELMSRYEVRYLEAVPDQARLRETLFPAFFALVSYVGGLRGEETPMLHLGDTRLHFEEATTHPKHPHVVWALRGRFKSELAERTHKKPVSTQTRSGLNTLLWTKRILDWYELEGETTGPVFRTAKGKKVGTGAYASDILGELENIQRERPDLIPPSVEVTNDYGMQRSFRRGSNSEARSHGCLKEDVDLNNRWSQVERAQGRKPGFDMCAHYSDIRLVLNALLKYSRSI